MVVPTKALLIVAVLIALGAGARAQPDRTSHTHLVIVVDGLRPDSVTPEVMPRLFRLGQRGVLFRSHHSVFPTVTRVNGSSFVTGAYAESHGLMGNVLYSPKVDPAKGLDTGERANLGNQVDLLGAFGRIHRVFPDAVGILEPGDRGRDGLFEPADLELRPRQAAQTKQFVQPVRGDRLVVSHRRMTIQIVVCE